MAVEAPHITGWPRPISCGGGREGGVELQLLNLAPLLLGTSFFVRVYIYLVHALSLSFFPRGDVHSNPRRRCHTDRADINLAAI